MGIDKIIYFHKVMDSKYLTPIEYIDGLYVKREDLFKPYEFSNANGSKLRQCILLVEKNINKAKSGIITGTSVVSPQSAICSSVARGFGFPCTIMYGGTNEKSLEKHKYPMIAKQNGANIIIGSKLGYTSAVQARASEYAKENNMFEIKYGFDLMGNLDAFIESVANQVENIPEVDNLVITVGSAITLIGVLYGISIYNKNIKNVYAYAIAPNRLEKIQKYRDLIYFEQGVVLPIDRIRYIDYFSEVGYNYNQSIRESIGNIALHPKYEAKTYHWLKKNPLNGSTLFWIVGGDIEKK